MLLRSGHEVQGFVKRSAYVDRAEKINGEEIPHKSGKLSYRSIALTAELPVPADFHHAGAGKDSNLRPMDYP